jgi:hypothetical protein
MPMSGSQIRMLQIMLQRSQCQALAPEMTFEQASALAHKATSWAAQAHHEWFWRGIPNNGYGL